MAEFLKTLLLMSLLGSALAVLLTLLRPLIAGRRVYYCLWLLVLARLCLPVGVAISLPGGEPETEPFPVPEGAPELADPQALNGPVSGQAFDPAYL